jgi:hypothetical protein
LITVKANEYYVYTDSNNQQLVLLNEDNNLIINKCIIITKIIINEINNICYDLFQITFEINKVKYIGYLKNSLIIVDASIEISCKEQTKSIIFPNQELNRSGHNINLVHKVKKDRINFVINANNYSFGANLNNHFYKLMEKIILINLNINSK